VTILAKAVSMWLVLLVAMTGNGILRVLLLQPRLGESLARQAACVSGMVLILGLTGLFVRRLAHPSGGQLLRIGLLWMVLTVGFEFLFGHYAAGASFEALLAEYNVMRGRLWPLVLLTTLLAPWLCDVVRPRSARII
jgi:hypothetical protein